MANEGPFYSYAIKFVKVVAGYNITHLARFWIQVHRSVLHKVSYVGSHRGSQRL